MPDRDLTDAAIDELERLAKAMTRGPYTVERLRGMYRINAPCGGGVDTLADNLHEHEAAYFAALNPAAVLALVREVRARRKVIDGMIALHRETLANRDKFTGVAARAYQDGKEAVLAHCAKLSGDTMRKAIAAPDAAAGEQPKDEVSP